MLNPTLNNNKTNKKEKYHIFLVFLLLIISGNPFIGFYLGGEAPLVIISIFLVWSLFQSNIPIIENKGGIIFFIFSIISLFQIIYFNSFPIVTIIGFLLRLFIGYAIIRLVVNFPQLYIKVLYKLCILAVIIWSIGRTGLLDGIILSLPELQYNKWSHISSHSVGFHTFFISPETGVLRNAGLFWEPGAFAGYIIVAMIFLSLSRQHFTKKDYKKYLFIFLIALLTTLSSAGYMLLPFTLFLGYNFKNKRGSHKLKPFTILLVISFIIPLGALFAFNNIDFLQEKISSQLQGTLAMSGNDLAYNNTRFGTMKFDWYYIKSSPIFGNGLHESTRYRDHRGDRVSGQGNGFTDFIAKFGLLGFCCFTYFLYAGLTHCFGRSKKILLTVFIMFASLNAEPFLNYPLYLGFMFLNLSNKKIEANNKHNIRTNDFFEI